MLYLSEAVCLLFSSALPLSAKIIKSDSKKSAQYMGGFFIVGYISAVQCVSGGNLFTCFYAIIPDKQQICLLFDES